MRWICDSVAVIHGDVHWQPAGLERRTRWSTAAIDVHTGEFQSVGGEGINVGRADLGVFVIVETDIGPTEIVRHDKQDIGQIELGLVDR